jgi:choice-of-anchor B domain-containing protein
MKRNELVLAEGLVRMMAVLAVAGSATGVLGDDDDKKLQDKKPAVVAQVWRNPDPWKLLSREPAVTNTTDATFPSRNVTLLTWMPLNSFAGFTAGANGADCWGYTSPSGREYALMGLSWGNGIVEVTNPASPTIVATIPGSVDVLWRDITVIGTYAYAVSDSAGVGIQVMDLSQIDNGVVTLVRNYQQGGHSTTHSMLSNPASGYLYLCGGNAANGGMIPANTNQDPTFPTFTGPGWTTRYVHEAFITSYTSGAYAGREIAFLFTGGSSTGSISIVDVTNKAAPVNMSTIVYPGRNYSHQGWISNDKKYLYHNDEIDGPNQTSAVPRMLTRVFDVSDLANPRLVTAFTNGLPSVDHNEYVHGRYLYQSNYTTGLRVWDMYDALRPVEVAYLDTRPDDNGTGYNGAWGNYPYFASGTVLVSDIERGLFIAKLSLLEFTPIAPLPTVLTPGQATPINISLAQLNAQFASAELLVSVNGAPAASSPMTLQGGVLSGQIPALACGDRVSYSVRAVAQSQDVFVWPLNAPTESVRAYVQESESALFTDNFETSTGWAVSGAATAGAWTRATPLANGGPGAVIGDADGSGMCYVTGNVLNADVDGGSTVLTSPVLDMSGAPEARVSYSRWLLSIVGTTDTLVTEVSGNNGTNWTVVETLGPTTGGWRNHAFRVADYVTPSAQVRVRFTVADADSSTTEAGIDAFRVIAPSCGAAPCYANCDGSSTSPVLNVQDFTCFLQRYAAGESYANCDNSTVAPVLNVQDFTCFLQVYAAGCP